MKFTFEVVKHFFKFYTLLLIPTFCSGLSRYGEGMGQKRCRPEKGAGTVAVEVTASISFQVIDSGYVAVK